MGLEVTKFVVVRPEDELVHIYHIPYQTLIFSSP